jgi:hypothetical protein
MEVNQETDIERWAKGIREETLGKWDSLKDKYNFSKYGFDVFYSPIFENPDLMILGYNPGGDEDSNFTPESALATRLEHEYFTENYRLAVMMKTIFHKIDKIELLRKSVKLNLIFFRSRNKNQYITIPKNIRNEMEEFCFDKINQIISRLNPKVIITEGVQTFDILKRILEKSGLLFLSEPRKPEEKGRRVCCKAEAGSMKIIGLLHLSGARPRPNEGELNLIIDALKIYLG